jgi:peptidylprolyl isomerase
MSVDQDTARTTSSTRAAPGDRVQIRYATKLDDGESLDEGGELLRPLWVVAGLQNTPMRPLFAALVGMAAGERKALTIPPAEAFGGVDADHPLAGRTLYVDVEVLAVAKKS